jgi:hypothetical protein
MKPTEKNESVLSLARLPFRHARIIYFKALIETA